VGTTQSRPGEAGATGLRGAVGEGRAQLRAAAVDAGADGAELEAQHVGDLLVAQPLDVAEHDGRPEVGGERGERGLDVGVEHLVQLGGVGGDPLVLGDPGEQELVEVGLLIGLEA
jgi:hypothetical protein